ncbi:MAG: UDP-3-O-(3-hydroxymyristoyl)glucosamine N-acyltransferase [Bacteriovoracaceae bacterium]|nr:UDP-3-O-(3-hydroxymyristoyl)glucosamine N-acyltransferase [Bacteriovoracaceae bacterium]
MKLKDLKKFDTTLEIIHGDNWSQDIVTIGHYLNPTEHSIYYAKNKKFFERVMSGFKKRMNGAGLIVEKTYLKELKDSDKNQFDWIATTQNVDLSMSFVSKPFYDEKIGNLNYQLDGRQLGTAEIHPTAKIAQNVFLGDGVKIAANAMVLPNATILPFTTIDEGSIIFSNVTLYPYTRIGKRVRIHAGTSIGTDGFGYNFDKGVHHKVWHLAGVVIEDDVEIGSNTCIDAGAFIATRIGTGSKIDNLVQVAHNVQIGRGVVICGLSGFGGSSRIGDYCVFAPKAGVAPDITIGAQSVITADANVAATCPEKSMLSGHPARKHSEWLKTQAVLRRLALGKERTSDDA